MRILVTGGAGFIGYHVAKALLERGDTVVIVDDFNEYYDPALKRARVSHLEGAAIVEADVADERAMKALFAEQRFECVCHLAAQAGVRASLEQPLRYERANSKGMVVLLEMLRKHAIDRFVFASSSSVYGANTKTPFSEQDRVELPISLYAATKRAGELYARTYSHLFGIRCTGLRFFTVYGPWGRPDMALFSFVERIMREEPIVLFNRGEMLRDFTYIDDIVQGVLAAIDRPFEYELINLGAGRPRLLRDFVAAIEKALACKATVKLAPMQPGDVATTHADISKARELLGYEPRTSIEQGVAAFVAWYREHYA